MSWFYRLVKDTLIAQDYEVFLENTHSYPGELIKTRISNDAIIVPPDELDLDFCFYTEIKSNDEYSGNSWLSCSGQDSELNRVRNFWRNNSDDENLYKRDWGVVISGQLEKSCYYLPEIELKSRVNMPTTIIDNSGNYLISGHDISTGKLRIVHKDKYYSMKRTIICEDICKEGVIRTLQYLGCSVAYNMDFNLSDNYSWIGFCILSFDAPDTMDPRKWYNYRSE